MGKIKTADLIGPALNYASAIANGEKELTVFPPPFAEHPPSVMRTVTLGNRHKQRVHVEYLSWQTAGPIIEREKITVSYNIDHKVGCQWFAYIDDYTKPHGTAARSAYFKTASTPLIAAMRCFIASRLGDEVEIPEELLA